MMKFALIAALFAVLLVQCLVVAQGGDDPMKSMAKIPQDMAKAGADAIRLGTETFSNMAKEGLSVLPGANK
ncbi:unnamed protein product [Phyllotreta striolata]|uniref:Uncharacterized protein n=1 Tax=Phyllotreta striolata TaxID=444603 RepID=A0A9N9TMK1_PHYSR|nr:unnamed protein product [Phyllotreta striolata]